MTSQRKLKKRAEALGMTGPELQLAELLSEVLADLRWMQILAYSNQYLLSHRLEVDQDERDQILEAATRAVDKDQKFHEWRQRLDRLKSELANIQRKVHQARGDVVDGASDGAGDGASDGAGEGVSNGAGEGAGDVAGSGVAGKESGKEAEREAEDGR